MHSEHLHQRADSHADAAGDEFRAIKPTIAIVGAGVVGSTLARLLAARGYHVTSITSRTRAHADALAALVGARMVESPEIDADLVLIAVPDDAISATAASLAGFSGKAAIHTSGVYDASVLETLAARGVQVGSLHPAYPFADVEAAIGGLPGATFALEATDEPLMGWLRGIVVALDGRVMLIPPGGKALYHAALSIAANYTVTLYALAERLLVGLGAERDAADNALDGLLAGTLANLRGQGIPAALTGALTRGDIGTIAAHLDALAAVDEDAVEVYRNLARLTYPLLRARGVALDEIERLLQQESDDAKHGP